MMKWEAGRDLGLAAGAGSLFADWLQPDQERADVSFRGGSASRQLGDLLDSQAPASSTVAPFFAQLKNSPAGPEWVEKNASLFFSQGEEEQFRQHCADLAAGKVGVVVTGQQPGHLGGPLYTLYKVATAIELARLLSETGRPTVPLFWAGDDDDDLAEAFAPRSFDPDKQVLWGESLPGELAHAPAGKRPLVGNLSARKFSQGGAAHLAAMSRRGQASRLSRDLAQIWQDACARDENWSCLFQRFLLRVFQGNNLIVVRGNDPFLHGCAAEFYQELQPRLESLRERAGNEGVQLVKAGYSLPLQARSLERPLFQVVGQGRKAVPAGQPLPPAESLRPAVMLRSLVQDWLFHPLAVVVGPGELAYLRQLVPVFAEAGVPRTPLVPRLSAQILPASVGYARFLESSAPAGGGDWAKAAGDLVDRQIALMIQGLQDTLGLGSQRAAEIAQGRRRRMLKAMVSLFEGEARRQVTQRQQELPAWVIPEGRRQERLLSAGGSLSLWGDDFVGEILSCARLHLENGRQGQWREYTGTVS